MALLRCRNCEAEISSDARVTRCKGCGTLFPFECTICGRSLRPPFPVYSDERYLSGTDQPLCPDHFQRQCPSCNTWFQADENAGYFMCKMCLEVHQAATLGPFEVEEEDEVEEDEVPVAGKSETPPHFPQWDENLGGIIGVAGSRDVVTMVLLGIICVSMVAVIGILIWQVISLLQIFVGG